MNVEIVAVQEGQKSVLRQLVELYLYDFSEYDQADVSECGYFGYQYLDHYWTEPGRHPFFVRVDGKLAGFALVSGFCLVLKDADAHSLAEFFVMRKYRRRGVGQDVAVRVFDAFPGPWELFQTETNEPSRHFWEKVVQEYTHGGFDIVPDIVDEWGDRGRVFVFDNSRGGPPAMGKLVGRGRALLGSG